MQTILKLLKKINLIKTQFIFFRVFYIPKGTEQQTERFKWLELLNRKVYFLRPQNKKQKEKKKNERRNNKRN